MDIEAPKYERQGRGGVGRPTRGRGEDIRSPRESPRHRRVVNGPVSPHGPTSQARGMLAFML